MTHVKSISLLSALLILLMALSSVAMACPASYVKQQADANQGTALYDKSAQVADKYMNNRGLNPTSPAGEVTRPYVIGTTIVEHNLYKGAIRKALEDENYYNKNERIDLDSDTVDEAVQKALGTYAGTLGTSNSDTAGHSYTDESGELAPCSDHFNRHFGNGIFESGDLPTQPPTQNHAG